ncbi:uncharacterized protein LOC119835825 [Zerene cesonia]|uniref:uncharacterized protein LOC119835825 n=1 Tax=Zerene cesonia TaxID=33412 RepID=UPI0018E57F05|nr:uncharacterized protein LOC119835825 [Zerene cesonia]XP_038216771.1 uncharacterized protein LOC119835825 [Zerene cesonia]
MAASTRFRCDAETGEIITYLVNEETGEPAMIYKAAPTHSVREPRKPRKPVRFPRGYMSRTKKFQTLKAKILAGSNTISHRLLLIIPTLMIFPSLVCVLLLLLELFLHVHCHKKNKMLKNPNLYYQSPFHVVTSIFCGVCRDCDTASKITALQDKRRYRYDYFKDSLHAL